MLVPGDATEAGVFSLRPATAYHIRIVAENELGTSEPSETVTIITAEEAPTGPPQDVKVDAIDKHALRVTWKPPPSQDWNGELQGYVEYFFKVNVFFIIYVNSILTHLSSFQLLRWLQTGFKQQIICI